MVSQPAWLVVGILGLISTFVFVYILYGTLFKSACYFTDHASGDSD